MSHCQCILRYDPTPLNMLLQPDPRSPNRLQRFACLLLSPRRQIPQASYLGLFCCSVSIQRGMAVNSEFITTITPVHQEGQPKDGRCSSLQITTARVIQIERVASLAADAE